MRCLPEGNKFPRLLEAEFIAPNSTIVGDVNVGRKTSLYFGVSIKGNHSKITIGSNSVILDNTQIVSNSDKGVQIGNNVLIGANAYIDSAIIHDNAVVGSGASVYKGAVIESGSLIAAGSVISPGTVVKRHEIWVGNPAKFLRKIQPEELENLADNRHELIELANVLVEETEKTQHEILIDKVTNKIRSKLKPEDIADLEMNMVSWYAKENVDEMGAENSNEGYHDIFDEGKFRNYDPEDSENLGDKFEGDLRTYPDYFKIYSENYKRYDEINKNAERIAPGDAKNIFQDSPVKPQRPGAMRAWVSKWDTDFNTTFKSVGSKVEQNHR